MTKTDTELRNALSRIEDAITELKVQHATNFTKLDERLGNIIPKVEDNCVLTNVHETKIQRMEGGYSALKIIAGFFGFVLTLLTIKTFFP